MKNTQFITLTPGKTATVYINGCKTAIQLDGRLFMMARKAEEKATDAATEYGRASAEYQMRYAKFLAYLDIFEEFGLMPAWLEYCGAEPGELGRQ